MERRKRVNINGKKNRTNNGNKGNGMVRFDDLTEIEPFTTNQELAFQAWDDGYNLVLAGCAGTGAPRS